MFKTILTHVRATPDGKAVLRLAAEFARAQGAQLIGVGGCEPYYPMGDYVGGDILQMIADQEAADRRAAEEAFVQATDGLGQPCRWLVVQDRPERALTQQAAAADLVLAGLERRTRDGAVDCSNLVMEAGLPVLAVPSTLGSLSARKILVAWRNTAEARAALSAAMPLLKGAAEVTLVEASQRPDDAWPGLNAAAGRLSRHGIAADAAVRHCRSDAAVTILEEAAARGSDLIVLGAYGHSRAREWVLGGVTRDLIESTPIPLLLAR